MANISKKALELISNLMEAGADPLEYMKVLEKQVARKPYSIDSAAHGELLGFQDAPPELKHFLREYSGAYSHEYNQPYRSSRAEISADIALKQDHLRWQIKDLEQELKRPHGTEARDLYLEQIVELERQLNEMSARPFKGYGERASKLLRTFHPSANDAVVYRGLNPGSRTARRLNDLENYYSQRAEGFSDEAIPAPTDYGNLGYLSTSVDPQVAKNFGDWSYLEDGGSLHPDDPKQQLYKILVPTGTPVRPLLNQLSDHGNEAEVLLPPMSVYERLGARDEQGFIPLLWTGRGKPTSKRYIGAGIPGAALLEQYYDLPEEQQ